MSSSADNVIRSVRDQWSRLRFGGDYQLASDDVISMLTLFKAILFPERKRDVESIDQELIKLRNLLEVLLKGLISDNKAAADKVINEIPILIDKLNKDAEAIYTGDPSARTLFEIILCYPGFQAVFGYRIAHIFYQMDVPVLPRIISEYYHTITGIDIHPGAQIGEYFCIDHGTGIVIGETTVIGDRVRMYHGVTLGVKNFLKAKNGMLLKGYKRHPNVGNDVVLYANATIMGNITLGDGCIIGANAVVTENVGNSELVKFEREVF